MKIGEILLATVVIAWFALGFIAQFNAWENPWKWGLLSLGAIVGAYALGYHRGKSASLATTADGSTSSEALEREI